MEIKPTYVTFEQAKLLKEKGFNENCNGHLVIKTGGIGKGKQFIHKGRLDYDDIYLEYVEENIPEQWQVVEWLRIKHNIWISADKHSHAWLDRQAWGFKIREQLDFHPFSRIYMESNKFDSPQEAYSAAIEHVLNKLI